MNPNVGEAITSVGDMSLQAKAKKSNTRVIYGLIVGIAVSAAAIFGDYVWGLMTLLGFFPIAYHEMMGLMKAKDIHPSKLVVCSFSVLFYAFAMLNGGERHFDVLVTMGIICTFTWLLFRKKRAAISDIGATIMMYFYLGFLPAHFILIRKMGALESQSFYQEPGLRYLFLVLFIVSASDIFAYYIGKRFGKNLLSPSISPKKTIEGSVGGSAMATLIGTVIAISFGIPWYHGLVLGILITLVAQMGDLSESLLKRDAGIKDSGTFIPGHGGILDRTDSYIFAGAVAYYYINWFVLHQGLAHDILLRIHGR